MGRVNRTVLKGEGSSSALHYFLALFAKSLDAKRDDIAFLEEHIGLLPEADARRRTCRDDITGMQAHELRQV